MILANLPALQVVLPLLAAPVCSFLPRGRVAWAFTSFMVWIAFAISVTLLVKVAGSGVISYEMGNWKPPFGIEYEVNMLSSFMLVIVSGIASVVMPYAFKSVNKEIEEDKQPLFYTMFLLCFAGLLGIIITNDAFNIYVFLEISSLATYALIATGKDRRALTASLEYLILGTIGATFILVAIGLLYMMTGTLNITDLALRVAENKDSVPIKAALAFFTIGLALKIAFFPMHLWLTNAYTTAPSMVSTFLAATATKVSIYILIKVLFAIYGYELSLHSMPLGKILMTFAIFAIIVGSLMAIFQQNVKRLLAYSSLAQIGYIILGIGMASVASISASLAHIAIHAFAKASLFMAVGCVMFSGGGVNLRDMRGIGKKMPLTSAAFVIAGLSLIGVPGTSGFISKWMLLSAVMEQKMWPVLFVILFSSVLAVIYIWKVVEVIYFSPPSSKAEIKEAPKSMLIPMWILVAVTIVFGLYSAPLVSFVTQTAKYIMGVPL